MFTMYKIKASKQQGESFYHAHLSANDYFSEGESIAGQWKGQLASDFNLHKKTVTTDVFSKFQQNKHPETGQKLTQRTKIGGIRFYDFQCSAQKSVSIMSRFDERLVEAHHKAVDFAMTELEKMAAVRLRKGTECTSKNYMTTGKIVYAQFHHDSSRALDPQLHAHNVVANVTWDEDNQCFKALETAEMCKAIRYAGKTYQNKLAHECQALGYDLITTRNDKGQIEGFELAGVSEDILQRYSTRRKQIEKEMEKFQTKYGRSPTTAEIGVLARITRTDKLIEISTEQVKRWQVAQLNQFELMKLQLVINSAKEKSKQELEQITIVPAEFVNRVIDHVFERDSVVTMDKILAELQNQSLGKYDLERLNMAVRQNSNLVELQGDNFLNTVMTTQQIKQQEQLALSIIKEAKNTCEPINPRFKPFKQTAFNDVESQTLAIQKFLNSSDRFMLLRGFAGTGKTTVLKELCTGIHDGCRGDIRLIAPTNSSVDVLRREGFSQSETVAKFLLSEHDLSLQNAVLIVDESGLNSLNEGVRLLQLAERHEARVIFVGDHRQHSSVNSGDFFRIIDQYSGIETVELCDIRRQQRLEYRQGVMSAARGDCLEALAVFDHNGWVKEGAGQYLDHAVQDYLEFTKNGRNMSDCLAIAPTHKECDKFTEKIRAELKLQAVLGNNGIQYKTFKSYNFTQAQLRNHRNWHSGDYLLLTTAVPGVGQAGQMLQIHATSPNAFNTDAGAILFSQITGRFEIGQQKVIELCENDIVRLSVNDKKKGFINGDCARIHLQNGNVEFFKLSSNGNEQKQIELPLGYGALEYGLVATSHRAQGMTCENVVIAAAKLDKKAFYVASSRGRYNMRLHCPDKQYFKAHLNRDCGYRESAVDVVSKPIAKEPQLKTNPIQQCENIPTSAYISRRTNQVIGRTH